MITLERTQGTMFNVVHPRRNGCQKHLGRILLVDNNYKFFPSQQSSDEGFDVFDLSLINEKICLLNREV